MRLRYRDWPGRSGHVLMYLAEPRRRSSETYDRCEGLAAALTPRWRVVRIEASADRPTALLAADALMLLDACGFPSVMLVAEPGVSAAARLLADWRPGCIETVVVLEASS